MINFEYARASDVANAVRQIAGDPGAKFIAGGTNLIDLMKEDVERPSRLIDISRLPLNKVEDTARLKGTFAQAELHIIRARLHGGKLNKASKGELRFALPVGFVLVEPLEHNRY